jgi:hypothetical protein
MLYGRTEAEECLDLYFGDQSPLVLDDASDAKIAA